MSTKAEDSHNSSIEAIATELKPQGFTLRRKIITGFSGLMLIMTLCIVITLYKLTTIEKSTISVIDHQQPTAILIVSLSEDLNLAISLLNEYLLSGDEEDILDYPLIEQRLFVYLEKIVETSEKSNSNISVESIQKLKGLLGKFGEFGVQLIYLRDNPVENYIGLRMANETLMPINFEYIGQVNALIEDNNTDEPSATDRKARDLLYKARYTWTQIITNMRLFFNRGLEDSLANLNIYAEINQSVLNELQGMDVDFGFDGIESLISMRTNYFKLVPKVIEYRRGDRWRADMHLMRSEVKPLVEELRSLLVDLVDSQVEATEKSGNALTLNLEEIRVYTTALLIFALICGLILSITITRSILPPIGRLMVAARRVADGDLDTEVSVKTKDEIGLLGGSFNDMVDGLRLAEIEKQQYTATLEDRVNKRTADLEQSEARIRAIHDNMGEGLIVIDEKGYIDSINAAAQKIFSVNNKDIVGMHAIFLLANKKFKELSETDDYNDEKDGPFITSHSKHPSEFEGKRIDGSTFPMEMVVTSITLGDKKMRACIVRDITRRKEIEESLVKAQNSLVDQAHKSGMAEIATGVLHNIGNILNSVNVSVEEVMRIARTSKISGLIKANSMLSDNLNNVGEFISNDTKGQKLPEYYIKIGGILEKEFDQIITESRELGDKTRMMKEVISTQQAYATASGSFTEEFQVSLLVEDALKVQKPSLTKWNVNVVKKYSNTPDVTAQKSKLLQVITNLIKNAKEAINENDDLNKHKEIVIEIDLYNDNTVYISVYDNGCGIKEENLAKIFGHGFTTKESGHGFGLHSSANAMTEMGGSLTVSSDGDQQGSCFTVSIPVADISQQSSSKQQS